MLPESVLYLWSKNKRYNYIVDKVRDFCAVNITIKPALNGFEKTSIKTSGFLIFKPSYLPVTLTFWLGLFTNLMAVNFLSNWFPLIVRENGLSLSDAALAGAIFQSGGTLGNVAIGWAMDRFGYHKTMFSGLLSAVIFCVALTQVNNNFAFLLMIAFFLGMTVNSVNTGWTSLSTRFYPTEIRATGTSVMTGVGRTGSILGAFVGGVLISSGLQMKELMMCLCIPLLICSIAVVLNRKSSS